MIKSISRSAPAVALFGRHDSVRRERLKTTRSLLLYHLLILARAIGILLSDTGSMEVYAPLHRWVWWSPAAPDVTWAMICLLAAFGGIWGWFSGLRRPTITAIMMSGTVMATAATGFTISGGWVPALVWGTIATWGLVEASFAPEETSK